MTRTWLTAALAATLVTCTLTAAPAGASVPATGRAAAEIPGPLSAVSCPAANACWAVGAHTGLKRNSAVLAQWNGSAWSQVPLKFPHGARSTGLSSVSCPGVTLCWAVGGYSTASSSRPYVLEWDGATWSRVSVPLPPNTGASAEAVSCSGTTDCWLVQASNGGIFEHWNGSTWTLVAAPSLGQPSGPALSCVSVSDCWLVGAQPTGTGTVTAHWNGSAWSVVKTPTSKLGSHVLSGISCLGTTCMAVGGNGARGAHDPVTQSWNGKTWTVIPPGAAGTDHAGFSAVSCTASTSCLGVGGRSGRQQPGAWSQLWNGTQWTTLKTPTSSPGFYTLLGVSCVTASDCWAVGGISGVPSTSLIEQWNGTAWSKAG